MYLDGPKRLRLGTAANRLTRWLAVLFPISIAGSVFGQNYLTPPAGFQGAPAVPSMGNVNTTPSPENGQPNTQIGDQLNAAANGQSNAQSNDKTSLQAEGEPSVSAPLTTSMANLTQWGALHLHERASYQFLYSTGIHSQPGRSEDTFTHTLTPGLTLDLGPHVTLDYSPSIRFFSERNFHNTVDHAASLVGSLQYGDWSFGLSQLFSATDEPMVQTSGQTQQTTFTTGLSAGYHLSDKMTLQTGAGVTLMYLGSSTNSFVGSGTNTQPSQLSDSQTYYASENLDYAFNERLSTGVGITADYAEQASGFRIVDQDLHGNLAWHPGDKLNAAITVGVQHRQILTAGSSGSWNPTFSANLGYHLFDQTTLSIYGNRSSAVSLFQDELSDNTTAGVGIQQRLLGKFQLNLGFGYTKADYKNTLANLATSRNDESTSYSAGLSFPFLTHCSFGTFYQYTQNLSTTTGFGYSSSQVGVTLSWSH